MKKMSLIIVLLIMVCSMVFAQDDSNKSDKNKMQVKAPQIVVAENEMKQPTNDDAKPKEPVLYKRGCCSHHGGVCGCDSTSGRQKCCDGTLSPSCRCSD